MRHVRRTLLLCLLLGLAVLVVVSGRLGLWGITDRAVARPKARDSGEGSVVANGLVEGAGPEIALRPEVPGIVVAIHAREGQKVVRGTILAELRNEAQRQQEALAEAEVTIAQADLDRLRNGARRERREAAAAQVRAQAAAFEAARAASKHADRLFKTNLLSADERDRSFHLMKMAEAAWEQAQAEQALVNGPPRPEELRAAEGRVGLAGARLGLARAELAKTRVAAPSEGHILRVYAEPGEVAGPASIPPALLMADLSKRRVRAFVEELDAPRVKLGQPVVVTADGLAGQEFRGVVAAIMPRMGKRFPRTDAPDEYRDLFFQEALVDLADGKELVPNLRVKVKIEVSGYPAVSR